MKLRSILSCALVATIGLSFIHKADARRLKNMPNPDFTKGEKIHKEAVHDWTLGATGARGWIYTDKMSTAKARQILITQVAKGSPAEGVLKKGDVILGLGSQAFGSDPRVAFGHALTVAESDAGAGKLNLLRWRDSKQEAVTVKLPVLGSYSDTAPYNCPKSKRIYEQGCKALAARIVSPGYKQNPISRSLNALALLASGDERYLPILKKEAQWAASYRVERFSVWYYGYVITFLSEYVMATGDDSVMPDLRELAMDSAKGQSNVGSWGHKFAAKDGRLVGYGMMNAPGVPLTIALDLSRRAGVKDPEISLAIERSAKLLRFYIGKGAVPYGDHHPWIRSHEDNGKCGMAAVLFNLLGESEGSKYFSRMSLAAHGATRDTGHTGNFWNIAWAMPGVNQSGPQATGAWMKEFGSWYYDLARGHDGLFRHLGPPQPQNDSTSKWDASGLYLLAYAMPLKKLVITGKVQSTASQLDAADAQSIIDDGRGWSPADPYSVYDGLPIDALMERLGSWSPVVRERAAIALTRKKDVKAEPIIALLDSPSLETRLGACQALAQFKGRGAPAAPAVPKLRETLKANDMWLRIKAADALAAIGDPAKPAIPEMLDMLIRKPSSDDPRAMEQRYLCFALFGKFLSNSIEGVDRKKLLTAMRAGLLNEDGRARGTVIKIYPHLTKAEIQSLMPAIHRSVVEPSPSGIMFANQSRTEGLKLLAENKTEEGIDACMRWLTNQNHWGSQKRTPELLEILLSYGVHAKRTIPMLEKLGAEFDAGIPHYFPKKLSKDKARFVREAIEKLKATTDKPQLSKLPSSL
ncbi:MAG: HEAT repeat domain-containing protein [Verrucomicrobiae bacterium]|nr:HEAT repeat domain-containing protein [Verrucomicrobiae bacterium]NNJ43312.1 acetylesterase [Akkermansiaceae bacterium]